MIVEADRFFSALELNKSKVASLKYEYSDLKDKLRNIQTEVDTNSETIRQIDEQIAQLQARRTELTRCISKKEKETVDLSYGQKMVANSIPKVVHEVQAANLKKPEWEMKKENAVKREEEIFNKFASLKGFYLWKPIRFLISIVLHNEANKLLKAVSEFHAKFLCNHFFNNVR